MAAAFGVDSTGLIPHFCVCLILHVSGVATNRRRAAAQKNPFSFPSSGHDQMIPEERYWHEGD